jgi:3-oxoacyl-[acyl-carrier protein] reductase
MPKTLDAHYVINMRAPFLLSGEFTRRFKQTKRLMGRSINLTSGQALGPMTDELSLCCY